MNMYPANERMIREVERGLSSDAVLAIAPGESPAAGDSILFALASFHGGQPLKYIDTGDSVRVLLTHVTELGTTDPATGDPLYRLAWKPLGQVEPATASRRKPPRTRSTPAGT